MFETKGLFQYSETVAKRVSEPDDTETHQLSLYYNKVDSAQLKKLGRQLIPIYFKDKKDGNLSDLFLMLINETAKNKGL